MKMQLNDCCLCLNSFTANSFSIGNPDLKSQMDKVFYFSVIYSILFEVRFIYNISFRSNLMKVTCEMYAKAVRIKLLIFTTTRCRSE